MDAAVAPDPTLSALPDEVQAAYDYLPATLSGNAAGAGVITWLFWASPAPVAEPAQRGEAMAAAADPRAVAAAGAAMFLSRGEPPADRRADAARLMNELMTGKGPIGGPFTLADPDGRLLGLRVVGPQLEDVAVRGEGVYRGADLLQDVAEVVERVDVVGLQRDRPAHQVDALERLALLVAQHPEKVQRGRVVLVPRQHLQIDLLGLAELALAVQRNAVCERRCQSPSPGRKMVTVTIFHLPPTRARAPRRTPVS